MFGVRYGVSKLYAVIIAVVIVVAAVATVMYVTSPAPTPRPLAKSARDTKHHALTEIQHRQR